MFRVFLAAALAAALGAGSVLAQYDLPISRADNREPADPKPVYNYELKPEHGEFLVIVQTFRAGAAGDRQAKELAEGLVEYIRTECKLYAYVHESGWVQRQERKKEKDAVVAAKRKYYLDQGFAPDQITDKMLEVKMARIADEYSVLVAPGKGNLKTRDEAIEFAKYIHKLKAPPAEFCDSVVVGAEVRDLARRNGEVRNPFLLAMPGRNPTAPKKDLAASERPKADDFLMSLNSGVPYSLIHKTRKPFTLVVQTYGSKFGLGRVVKPGEVMQAGNKPDGEMLERAAQQAQTMAEVLRKGTPAYDAYVLHTKFESFVCVGEYDTQDDPQLLANAEALKGMQIKDQKTGQVIETFMEKPLPAKIPRP